LKGLLRLAATIDRGSSAVGRLCSWLALLMVLVGAYNAVVRYLGRWVGSGLSSNSYIEAQWYMFSLLFLLGAAWTLQQDAHVRVDVIYGRLSAEAKAWIDLLGTAFFLLPFCVFGVVVSWPSVRNSWSVREVSPDPGGLARYPLKTVILIAFVLLGLQGISTAIKALSRVRGEEEA
jgi:TRAP-type mannitol/chloroaromatic compound transport system permease small subunit